MVGGTELAKLGDGGYDIGARAHQIRDDLRRLRSATPKDMLDIQLDDRAVFLERWHNQLLSTLSKPGALSNGDRAEFRRRLGDWSGRANVDSVAYRLVRAYREEVARRVFEPISNAARRIYPGFSYDFLKFEDPLWSAISSQPMSLLDHKYEHWNALFLSAVDTVIEKIKAQKDGYSRFTVGDKNATRIQHPMGAAIHELGALLNMSVDRLPGDRFDMPRIQAPTFGSSLRMAVSPGREKEGYLIMACGESGNPLSPHYRDCHKARVTNARTPFLPGASTRRLLCHPCPQRSALRTLCFPTDRSRHRSLQRSHWTTSRVLLAQGLPRQTALGAFLRHCPGSSLLFPNQSAAAPGANYLPTLQNALAGRTVLQVDQAASANQALLRKLDERSQNSGMDRGERLCAGGDIKEGASTTTRVTQHFTNFECEHV